MGPTKEVEEIPVYMFMGFLESGKTSFIKEILEDHEFTEGKKVLVICCEEGVEEYEEEVLADGNAVTELTGLGRCLNVRTLHLNGANVSDLSELRALTKLQDITLSHCTRRELLIPLHKSSLTRVTLVDCDLRGDFFHSFDRERAITSLTLIRCELDSTSGLDGFTGLTELTLRDVSGALDWSALGSLPLQTVTADAMQADAVRASGTTAAVTVTD